MIELPYTALYIAIGGCVFAGFVFGFVVGESRERRRRTSPMRKEE